LSTLNQNPIDTLRQGWLRANKLGDANARYCTLASQDPDESGFPRVRTVVLRDINQHRCLLFLNQSSKKNLEELDKSRYELLLFYPSLMEQYRIRGDLKAMPLNQLYQHWQQKPYRSKLLDHYYHLYQGQSTSLETRESINQSLNQLSLRFPEHQSVPFSPNAMGLEIAPRYIEMWKASDDGIHQRDLYLLQDNLWSHQVLVP